MDLTATEIELTIFSRLSSFAEAYEISLTTFWNTTRLCLTLEEFIELLHKIEFEVSHSELQRLA